MKNHKSRLIVLCLPLILLISLIPLTSGATGLISSVRVDTTEVDALAQSPATISWTLTEPTRVSLFICDIKGKIIIALVDKEQFEAGDHSVQWDGLDQEGNPAGNGVYFPVIKVKSKRKGTFVYNPSSELWGENVPATDLHYDAEQQLVSFSVDRVTYGRLRVGIKEGGPVYRTLAPWALYMPGEHKIAWNGKDKVNMNGIMHHEAIAFSFDAFSLPENSLVVSGIPEREDIAPDDRTDNTFPIHPPSGGRSSFFAQEPGSQWEEPELTVRWKPRGGKKEPIQLTGKASCEVSFAEPGKKSASLNGRSELILYLDDTYIREMPVDQLPATLELDTTQFKNGAHVLIVNLLTVDDRAGISIQRVEINN